ncbi:MAG TPA: PH domain-containing protein [Allosphingosinicella sp.]|nr:PH domain-containing protein [Allosphingosinicella sp.]
MSDPPAGAIANRRVHPATIPLRFVKGTPSTLLGLPALFAFMSDYGLTEVLAFAAAAAMAGLVYQWLAWRRFRYGIGERDLVIESGILSRTRRSIPFNRIQDVDIERGPLARLFGLAKLRIETGGSGSDEGMLDSVTLAEAERLRDALRAARNREAVATDPAEAALLFEMSVPRVLAAGLLGFSMVYLAGLFAVLQAFDDWLPFDIYDPGRWIGLADERFGGRWSFEAIAAVALLAVLLGIVTGVGRTLARDYGFRLTLEAEGFRRRRGLVTHSEVLLPKRRVQLALAETGPIRRALGWHALAFQTLSGRKPAGGGRQSVAPLARRHEIEPILRAQNGFRLAEAVELTMVSSRHFFRRLAVIGLLPLVAILAGSMAAPALLFALALLPPLAAAAYFERRFHRYGIFEGLLFVQAGLWRQRQWIVPLANIQSLRLSRSWLQRRLELATLAFDTAGGSALDPPRIVDLREERARALVAALRGGC